MIDGCKEPFKHATMLFCGLVIALTGNFRVALDLIIKEKLSAKFLLGKLVFIHVQTKVTYMKSFALSLAFIMRFTATQKWPIEAVDISIPKQ